MRLVEVLREIRDEFERAFTLWAHEFVLRQHAPEDLGDGQPPYCTNHWRPRVQPWPCKVVIREQERWDAKRRLTTDVDQGT